MAVSLLKAFARKLFAPRTATPARPVVRRRLGVEPLEDRLTPAILVWQPSALGLDPSGHGYDLSSHYNWSTNTSPQKTDDLQFGSQSSADNYTVIVDQLTAVNSITFEGVDTSNPTAYKISGDNALTVGSNVSTRSSYSGSDAKSGAIFYISAPVDFVPTVTTGGSINVPLGTDTLVFNNTVDNGGLNLTVNGNGAVQLLGPATVPNVPPAPPALSGAGALILEGLTAKGVLPAGAAPQVTLGGNGGSYGGIYGTTVVNEGTLFLKANSGYHALPGDLTIGTGQGSGVVATVEYNGEDQIASVVPNGSRTAHLAVNDDGLLALYSHSGTIGALTLNGGAVTTSYAPASPPGSPPPPPVAGTLTLGDDVTVLPNSTRSSTISGILALGAGDSNGVRVFNVGYGSVQKDLNITANVVSSPGGGTVGFVKTGEGYLALAGNNTYTGATDIQYGTLWITAPAPAAGTTISTVNALAGTIQTSIEAGASLYAWNPNPNSSTTSSAAPVTFVTNPANGLLTIRGNGDPDLTGGAAFQADGAGYHTTDIWAGPIAIGNPTNPPTLPNGTPGTIAVESSTTLDVTGAIGDDAAAPGSKLTKIGPGTLVLDAKGGNTYTGSTTINAGYVVANHVNSLGATNTGVVTVNGTSSLLLAGGTTFAEKALVLNGTGGGSTSVGFSALQGLGAGAYGMGATGTNTWTGPVQLGSTAEVSALDGDTLVIADANVINDGVAGVVSGPGALDAGRVTTASFTIDDYGLKTIALPNTALGYDDGTVELGAANTYSGGTTVQAGVLAAANSSALGAAGGTTAVIDTVDDAATLQLLQSFVDGSSIAITGQQLNLNGEGVGSLGALRNYTGNNIWAGNVKLATTSAMGTGATGDGTGIGAALAGGVPTQVTITGTVFTPSGKTGELDKVGNGTIVLSGNNTYAGPTYVNAGTLAGAGTSPFGPGGTFGSAGQITASFVVTVTSGATLALEGATVSDKQLVLNGTGYAGNGALWSASGTNTWSGGAYDATAPKGALKAGIYLATNATFQASSGSPLTVYGPVMLQASAGAGVTGSNLTVQGSGNITFAGQLSGNGGLVMNGNGSSSVTGNGTLTIQSGANNYAGTTAVASGTLGLNAGGSLGNVLTASLGAGKVTVSAGAELLLAAYTSGVIGTGGLTNYGTLDLSGVLTVNGGYTQNGGGNLTIEFNNASGNAVDGLLSVTGGSTKINSGATLTVNVASGSTPPATLPVIEWTSSLTETGNFPSASGGTYSQSKSGTLPPNTNDLYAQ